MKKRKWNLLLYILMIKPVIDIIVLQILDDKARKEFNDDMFMQYYNSTKYVGIALVPIVFIVTGFLIKKIYDEEDIKRRRRQKVIYYKFDSILIISFITGALKLYKEKIVFQCVSKTSDIIQTYLYGSPIRGRDIPMAFLKAMFLVFIYFIMVYIVKYKVTKLFEEEIYDKVEWAANGENS